MSQPMQRCPNCGAYVMSDDNICPRCDHRLDQPAARVDPATEIFESPAADDVASPIDAATEIFMSPAPIEAASVTDPATEVFASPALDEDASTVDPAVTEIFDSLALDVDESPEMVEVTPAESEADVDAEAAPPAGESAVPRDRLPTTRLPFAAPMFKGTPAAAPEPPAEIDLSGADEEPPAADDLPFAEADAEEHGDTLILDPAGRAPDEDQVDFDDLVQEAEPQAEAPAVDEEPPAAEEVTPAPVDIPAPFDLPESGVSQDTAHTVPHLEDQLRIPEPDDEDTSELPTARLTPDEEEVPFKADETARQDVRAAYFVPPAPYTPPPTPTPPPPARITPPPASYGYGMPAVPAMSAATTYLQQRVQAYRQGGYRLHVNSPYEATLSYGKGLGALGWMLALVSIIGFFWYVLLMALGGFQRDIVDIVLEGDGRIYEDGSGAAHIRRHRSRVGRRWATFGAVIFMICLVLAIGLGAVAGIVLRNDRYQAAMRDAYPAVTLFEEHFSATQADPADVSRAKDGAVAYAIVAGIAVVGLWGGVTLWVIGTIHAKTYRVHVPPLPGW